MKTVYRFLFGLNVFVGIGGMAGGLAAITNPQNPLGIPADTLKNSPFTDFLIPGILLFTVIGLGNIVSALSYLLKSKYHGYTSSVFSWALVIWIIVQCIMLNAVAALHIIFFIIGLIQAALSASILFEKQLFPANIVTDIYNRLKNQILPKT